MLFYFSSVCVLLRRSVNQRICESPIFYVWFPYRFRFRLSPGLVLLSSHLVLSSLVLSCLINLLKYTSIVRKLKLDFKLS